MREPGNKKPARSKKSVNKQTELDKHRDGIAHIERLFITVDKRSFTESSLNECIKQIRTTIIWIRDNLDKNRYNKRNLHKTLEEANTNLMLAIDGISGRNKKNFYIYIEKGRECLERALIIWEHPSYL